MTVESATYIGQLNPLYPATTDYVVEARQHLTLIKQTLIDSFPSLGNAAVTVSAGAINNTTAIYNASVLTIPSANTGTSYGASLNFSGDAVASPQGTAFRVQNFQTDLIIYAANSANAFTSNYTEIATLSTTGVLNLQGTSAALQINGGSIIPSGLICMWAKATIPSGWVICDGTNGTPDLRNSFIVGAGGAYALGAQGGTATQVTSMDVQGYHSHFGAVQGVSLTTDQLPSHTHTINDPGHSHTYNFPAPSLFYADPNPCNLGSPWQETTGTSTTGITINPTGSGNPHAHVIYADGSHAHNIASWSNLPPFYAIYYIMKT